MDQIAFLTRRVYRLEQEVARLKGAPLEDVDGPIAEAQSAGRMREAPVIERTTQPDHARLESEVAGTWFARVGAVALILGAGFAFKYGIDRGLIGPWLRVVLGLLAGSALVGVAEWAARRRWPVLAQAIAGAGTAILFLSVWAAYHLYGLMGSAPAFVLLFGVTVVTGSLAVRHDSQVLAIIATIGGILDPIVVGGRSHPAALFGYLLVLDASVLGVGIARRWNAPAFVAFAGTWLVFGSAVHDASLAAGFGYASALFAVFSAPSFARRHSDAEDASSSVLVAMNAAAYFLAGAALLGRGAPEWRGAFAAALGVLHLWAGGASWTARRNNRTATTALVAGQVLAAAAVALHLHGNAVPMAWAIEAVAFIWIALATQIGPMQSLGLGLLTFSTGFAIFGVARLGAGYRPERLLISDDAGAIVAQIAGLYVAGWLLHRRGTPSSRRGALAAVVGANAVTVAWLSFEALARSRSAPIAPSATSLPFTLSAIWALYAAALLGIGFAMRVRGARMMSLALFGLTIVKMALVDLWLLPTGYRVLAFLGIGVLLLTASLTYHRFHEMIAGESASAAKAA